MLQCGLSCESIEDIFDESAVKTYVKSDLEKFLWIGDERNRVWGHLAIFFLVLHQILTSFAVTDKNNSLSVCLCPSSIPASLSVLVYNRLVVK